MPKIIAIIPARRDSKRLKGKNKMLLNGKPLICYTIEQALQCDFIDEIIVSTNDEDIIKICKNDFIDKGLSGLRLTVIKRPEELAQDDSKMEDVIFHVIEQLRFDLVDTKILLLQPTSPLRTSFHISHAYQIFKERMSCTLVSVYREDDLRFTLNGALYIFSIANLYFTNSITKGEFMGIYIMDKESSLDIDTLDDFKLAEALMKKRLEDDKNER